MPVAGLRARLRPRSHCGSLGRRDTSAGPGHGPPAGVGDDAVGSSMTMSDQATRSLWICEPCGFVYDPEEGDPDGGIEPGTPFEDIPDDWMCPICGAAKSDFRPLEPGEQFPG